jgi:hypothetical protein
MGWQALIQDDGVSGRPHGSQPISTADEIAVGSKLFATFTLVQSFYSASLTRLSQSAKKSNFTGCAAGVECSG